MKALTKMAETITMFQLRTVAEEVKNELYCFHISFFGYKNKNLSTACLRCYVNLAIKAVWSGEFKYQFNL